MPKKKKYNPSKRETLTIPYFKKYKEKVEKVLREDRLRDVFFHKSFDIEKRLQGEIIGVERLKRLKELDKFRPMFDWQFYSEEEIDTLWKITKKVRRRKKEYAKRNP